jgi:hypothetical protein
MSQLIPCADGTMADPIIGCLEAPASIINPNSGMLQLILHFSDGLMKMVIAVSTMSLIYGALRYITANGNEAKLERAKGIIFWSMFGLIVALISKMVVAEAIKIVS